MTRSLGLGDQDDGTMVEPRAHGLCPPVSCDQQSLGFPPGRARRERRNLHMHAIGFHVRMLEMAFRLCGRTIDLDIDQAIIDCGETAIFQGRQMLRPNPNLSARPHFWVFMHDKRQRRRSRTLENYGRACRRHPVRDG